MYNRIQKLVIISGLLAICGTDSIARNPLYKQNEKKQNTQTKQDLKYHPKAADLVIQGAIFDLKAEYNKALNAYNEALIYDPDAPSIYMAIAKDYVYLRKVDSAIRVLKRCIEIAPDYLEGHHLLATIYHRKGQMALAEIHYSEIIKLDSTNLDASLNLASIYLSENKTTEAAELYENIIKLGLASDEIRFQLGNLYFKDEKYDEAHRVYKQYVREYPENEQGYLAVGAVLIAKEDTSEAINWYKKIYEKNNSFLNVREELVSNLAANNDWNTAIQIIEEAVKKDSTDIISKIRLGELHFDKHDTTEAITVFTNITNTHPDDWRGHYKLAQTYFRTRKFSECIPFFDKALEVDKNKPKPVIVDVWFHLGLAYQQEGRLDTAEVKLRKAQELAPSDVWTNFYLGSLLYQIKQFEEALNYLTKSLQKGPNNPLTLSTLAAVYDEIGEHDKCSEFYEKALQVDPDNATILNNFSYSLSVRGERLEQALDMANKALEADPDNGAFLDTIGWVYFQLGDYEKALEYIKKSVSVRDGSAEVFEHLGDVYEKLGQMKLATQYWKKAMELEPDRESLILKLKIN